MHRGDQSGIAAGEAPAKMRPVMADSRPPSAAPFNENVLRAFLASPAMMAVTRLSDGVLVDANAAFLEAGALTREEAIGRRVVDLGIWDDDRMRIEYRTRLQQAGRVQDFEARFRNRRNQLKDISINAEVVRIDGEPCAVLVALDITERRRREREQAAVYRISEAARSATNLPELLQRIHAALLELMPAKNFFVARLDAARDEVSFPLFIDEVTPPPPPRPHGHYLSDYVIRTGQPLLLRHDEIESFRRRTGYAPRFGWCKVWLGAPLVIDGKSVGNITVQDYQDERAYQPEDVPFFSFVASQVAAALQRYEADETRRRIEAMRRESEDYFAKSFHASPALMLLADLTTARIIEPNAAFLRASGFTREEVVGRTSVDLGVWVDREERERVLARLRTHGAVHGYETVFRNKSGEPRYVLLNADVFELGGRPAMLITAIDLTERRRREREQAALYRISAAALDAPDHATLFSRVHTLLAEILPARSFFIALYDREHDRVTFPLWNNAFAPEVPPPRPLGRSLTDYVLATGQPLWLTEDKLDAFTRETGYAPLYGRCAAWIAAPLLSGGRALGAVSLQDYDNPDAYRPEDQQLLEFVANQLVAALQRVEAEARLRESQEYFSKLFHSSPAPMTIRDAATGALVDVNEAFVAIGGYTREEIMAANDGRGIKLWANRSREAQFLAAVRAKGHVRNFEAEFTRKDGRPLYVHLTSDLLEIRGRRCLLTVGLDITDQYRRDQLQRATYRISRAVLARGDLGDLFREIHETLDGLLPAKNFYVALLSPDGRDLSFPYFVDELTRGRGVTPPPRRRGLGFTEYVIECRKPLMITSEELTRLLRAQGDYQPPAVPPSVRLGAPLLIEGRLLGIIAIHDYHNAHAYDDEALRLLNFVAEQAAAVVQRRTAEEALQRAERQYRGIFENALEGLYQSSADGRFLRVNPAFAHLAGYDTPADFIAAITDIGAQFYTDPNRRAEFMQLIRNADEVTDFESEITRRDGTRVWMSESVRVVRDAAGQPAYFEGVAIDITARREADRALRAAKEAADEASRAKSQFLASMSHELRTPLNGILGYTQILNRDPALSEKQRNGLAIIHQSADHLLALINDVLDLAKIEARKLELHPTEFGLGDFAQHVAEVFGPRAREKNLRLETAFAADLPRTVRCDAQRLRQVLFNLLSNAVKFTHQGGVVFSMERSGPAVRFSVSDSGPGIAPADQKRLFEPFAQLGDQGQRAGGTGLGLNVSRSILEQMGSRLMVDSQPGWGTRFWFELQLPEVGADATLPAGSATPWKLCGYEGPVRRVLVADDHEPNRRLLSDLLQPLGFEVATANDGEEAVRLAREFRPHLALLDVRMPRLDGFAAARRLRAELGADAPCIVAVSASAHNGQHAAALAAGCAAFLAKPFREDHLFGLIGRHLDLRWKIADSPPPPPGETIAPFPALPHPPSAEQAERLFELASSGDVLAVRTYAQQLAAQDPRLAAFAQQVIELASRFKMKAIRSLVGRYRSTPTDHA